MNPSIGEIKDHVARAYSVSVAEIDSPRRATSLIEPRHLAMYLVAKETSCSLVVIGRHFGDRDHTTVINAIGRIEERLATNPDFAARLADIKATMPTTNGVEKGSGHLDVIAREARRQAVRRAKTNLGAFVYGRRDDLRDALKYLYHETPVATGESLAGGIVELLVADTGTWSIIETSGDLCMLSICGTTWKKGHLS